ncbi:MAG: hypothetical protein WBC55_01860 [Dehalococcoidia bacterium]
MIKCESCGYEGPSSEFRYLGLAEEMGPNTYRQCPKCHCAVYCEELEFKSSGKKVWGTGGMRGQVFAKRPARGEKGKGANNHGS